MTPQAATVAFVPVWNGQKLPPHQRKMLIKPQKVSRKNTAKLQSRWLTRQWDQQLYEQFGSGATLDRHDLIIDHEPMRHTIGPLMSWQQLREPFFLTTGTIERISCLQGTVDKLGWAVDSLIDPVGSSEKITPRLNAVKDDNVYVYCPANWWDLWSVFWSSAGSCFRKETALWQKSANRSTCLLSPNWKKDVLLCKSGSMTEFGRGRCICCTVYVKRLMSIRHRAYHAC